MWRQNLVLGYRIQDSPIRGGEQPNCEFSMTKTLPMGFSWQEYWSGLPFPSPVALPDPGIGPGSPALQADSLLSEPSGKPNLETALRQSEWFPSGSLQM